jgi:hypothetical protein
MPCEDLLMTCNRDLKRRVRQRQAETGESYVTALRHVRAAAPDAPRPEPPPDPSMPPISYLELIDVTEIGAALGMQCEISMYPDLIDQVEIGAMLRQFRAALPQPQLAAMRAVVMRGAPVDYGDFSLLELRSFHLRIARGQTGVSPNGFQAALAIDGKHGSLSVAFMLMVLPRSLRHTRLVIASTANWRHPWAP